MSLFIENIIIAKWSIRFYNLGIACLIVLVSYDLGSSEGIHYVPYGKAVAGLYYII